jgi:hypothetical protein
MPQAAGRSRPLLLAGQRHVHLPQAAAHVTKLRAVATSSQGNYLDLFVHCFLER